MCITSFREVPLKFRRNVATETAVYLREAIARFPVQRLGNVPDEERISTYGDLWARQDSNLGPPESQL